MFSGDTTMLYDYLDGILNTVQFKDAAVRLGISNIAALETATRYLFDSVDNLVNPKSIADVMTSMGTKISSLTIFNYLKGLAAAFILYPVRHYDIKDKRALRQERMYYAADLGIRCVLCFNKVRDTGRLLENVLFLELMRIEGRHLWGKVPAGRLISSPMVRTGLDTIR